jgi:hypothetical protein
MDTSKPFTDLCGLVISGECQTVTPTPTVTPADYCIVSGLTFTQQPFECPFDGTTYYDIYGKLKITATIGGQIVSQHPPLSALISNGLQSTTLTIPNGQTFVEYNYIKSNFTFSGGSCVNVTNVDWYVVSATVVSCLFFTPTPTPTLTQTPTVTPTLTITPTLTKTPTPTVTRTPNPFCPQELYAFNTNSTLSASTGTYTRQTLYTGGTMTGGYFSQSTNQFVSGPHPLDGNTYTVYAFNVSGTTWYNFIAASLSINRIGVITSSGGPLNLGGTPTSSIFALTLRVTNDGGGIIYPAPGIGSNTYVITYPTSCPTPTPTLTQTITPTITQTNTPSVTQTRTPTPTPIYYYEVQSQRNCPDVCTTSLTGWVVVSANILITDFTRIYCGLYGSGNPLSRWRVRPTSSTTPFSTMVFNGVSNATCVSGFCCS